MGLVGSNTLGFNPSRTPAGEALLVAVEETEVVVVDDMVVTNATTPVAHYRTQAATKRRCVAYKYIRPSIHTAMKRDKDGTADHP
jgi:hypothetical protein